MPGSMHLYIYDDKVYRVPVPKDNAYKSILELANKTVLYAQLIYNLENKKPKELINIYFENFDLDNNGQYILTDEKVNRNMYNVINFGFTSPNELSLREDPWVIPQCPVIPNSKQKSIIISYLRSRYPSLERDALWVIENYVNVRKRQYNEIIDLIREANKLRNQKEKR